MSKPIRILRRPEVEHRTGFKHTAIYKGISEDNFPKPIELGARSRGWIESEIDDWIAERIAKRNASKSERGDGGE